MAAASPHVARHQSTLLPLHRECWYRRAAIRTVSLESLQASRIPEVVLPYNGSPTNPFTHYIHTMGLLPPVLTLLKPSSSVPRLYPDCYQLRLNTWCAKIARSLRT